MSGEGEPGRRRRILIVANPAAGRSGRTKRRLARVMAALQRRGCSVVLRQSGATTGEVERLAREAEADFDVVVAAGGDGTVNAVANGLCGTARPIAILPFGTANVLAHEIGLPRRSEALAELIAAGPVRVIWPGRVGDRLFLTMASSGFDAETVAAVNPRLKRRIGRLAFAWAIVTCLLRYRERDLRIQIDGAEHRAATVIATKGRLYAGPYLIAPEADLAEPILHLVVFQRSGRCAVLRYLGALLSGRIARRDDVALLRAHEACVFGSEPVLVQADGELVGRLPMNFAVAATPLYLVRP